ncbi:MAG TPA: TetR/AcrR family transcriptional regulator C-terminal domain-containing protein [Gemmatimonadaceae bacterium]
MGRPPKFSREQLKQAALAIVDEHGLAALSMRSLAAAVGTGAMTLYNHVADRAELDALVVDGVMSEARWKRARYDDWRDEVRAVSTAIWRAIRSHPRAIPLILTRRSRSPALAELSEALLRGLARSGRSKADLLIAFRAVSGFLAGLAQAELAGPLSVGAGEQPLEVIERFMALPADRFPHLIEIANAATRSSAEREFKAGLELLIAGLSAPPPKRRR